MTNVTSAKDQIFELCNAKELKKKKNPVTFRGLCRHNCGALYQDV